MIALLVEGEPVLCGGEPHILEARSDPPGFCILRDAAGQTRLVHESRIEDSSLKADVAWNYAKNNSK